MLIVSADSPK